MPTKTFDQFRQDNVVTTLPVSLPYGVEKYYKDPQGRLSLYVGDEDGDAQLAVRIDSPTRVVNVFAGAPDVAPNFDSFAEALTYAQSLSPSTSNPVSIRLFAQANGTPYTITGSDDWYALALQGIYVSSPFREIFSTTTLPTTLPRGMRVMYVDGNGVESLWVGRADGSAWPACGYKEYTADVDYNDATSTIDVRVRSNTLTASAVTPTLVDANGFSLSNAAFVVGKTFVYYSYGEPTDTQNPVFTRVTSGAVTVYADVLSHGELNAGISIHVYP